MLVKQFYEGKSVLITGATGFIGKVVLEKLLRDIPNIGKIYIIVRRSDSTPKQRFEDEIVASRVFDVLREKLRDDFIPFVTTKVVPIGGDLSQHNVGISSEDMAALTKNVNVIIHLAASIDFKERLDKAVESNVLGTLRLFNLAKKFTKLQAFIHCSTAYVNSNRLDGGVIDEALPPITFDPEEMVRTIMAKHKSQIDSFSDKLLRKFNYPNTYTFTKAISEHILALRRGNMPIFFVRPTIVGATLKEPFPGWVDSVAAVGAVILYVGVGVVHFIKGQTSVIADIIPCDHVANALIIAAPLVAGQDRLRICHVGTSTTNPESWYAAGYHVDNYWHNHPPKKSIGIPSFVMHDSALVYESRFFLKYTAPATLFSIYATLFGNNKQKKDAERFNKLCKASRLINDTFIHFTSNGWAFNTKHLLEAMAELDEEDNRVFFTDTKEISWKSYYDYFCFGLHKYMLKEEGVKPPSQVLSTNLVTREDIIAQKNYLHWIFADVSWAVTSYYHITQPPVQPHATGELKSMVLTSKTVKDVVATLAAKHGLPLEAVEKRAITTLDRIAGTITVSCVRFMAWFLKKLWRRLYTALHIDEQGLQRVREAIKKAPVVLIPTHRSYLDFLILSYVFFAFDLPMPRIAAGEDFLSVFIVRWIFKNCGAFFLRRTFDGDALYWAVFAEYVEQLVIEHDPVEFFIEGKRSRSGKSLHPKLGMLNMTMQPFLDRKVPDLQIVPISISYDKVLEGELYTQEMMGESKAKESLNGLMRASKVLRMKWGSINVVFAPPISAKQYTEDFIANRVEPPRSIAPGSPLPDPYANENDRRDLLHTLSYEIVAVLDKNIVITSTAIVATVLLAGRRGISKDELISKCDWLREEIYNRGAEVAFEGPAEAMVDYALKLMSNLIQKRRNMYEPTQTVAESTQTSSPVPNTSYRKNILVLSYYRNQLLHLFQWEGAIAIVIAALAGMKSSRKKKLPIHGDGLTGVEEQTLIEEATFLAKLWSAEFVHHPNLDIAKVIMRTLDKMTADGVIVRHTVSVQPNPDVAPVTQRLYKISSRGEGILTFLCQMFWPYVETYFIACLTLFTTSADAIKPNVLAQRMGWLGEKMFDEGKLNFFESCNTEILSNAINLFVRMGILTKKPVVIDTSAEDKKKKGKKADPSEALGRPIPVPPPDLFLAPPYASKNGALGEFAKHIGKYRKTSPITTKTTDLAISLLEDFPLIARL
jgi:glycerol-3-phosphate O-acyltransferase/nucleoside-diphosphate-sugar epimerase